MSRTLTAAMAGHISGTAHTRCNMLRLDLKDGTSIGVTDHDSDLTFDLGDGLLTYSSGTGILSSNVALSCGLDADNFEVTGPIADIVTRDGVLGGRFNRARARLFEVNWKDLTQGALAILAGNVSEARVEGGKFVMEIRADVDRFNQTVGRVITDQCDADFGDGIQCHATPVSITGTVTAATDGMSFTVSFTGTYASKYFNKGTVQFLTGALAGNMPVEIESWTGAGAVSLFSPLAAPPLVGDTLTIRQGCFDVATGEWKSRTACMSFGQILFMRGYPEVPGRKALMPAIPGQ